MSEERNQTEYIDAYLDGILTAGESELFQQKMQDDPAFRLEVEAQGAVRLLVLKAEKKTYFRQLEEELFTTTALIDRYLEGGMMEGELEWFEQKLSEDELLQQDVEAQRMIIQAVKRQELKKKFLDIERELETEKEEGEQEAPVISMNRTKTTWMAIAASVAILLSVAAIFFLNQPQQNQLYASYSIELDNTALGYADDKLSMEVVVMESEEYPLHYTLQDNGLTIFLKDPNLSEEDIQIEYDPAADQPYMLRIKQDRYLLDYTADQPQPLKAIQ